MKSQIETCPACPAKPFCLWRSGEQGRRIRIYPFGGYTCEKANSSGQSVFWLTPTHLFRGCYEVCRTYGWAGKKKTGTWKPSRLQNYAAIHFRDGCPAMGKENDGPGIWGRYHRQRMEIWLYLFNLMGEIWGNPGTPYWLNPPACPAKAQTTADELCGWKNSSCLGVFVANYFCAFLSGEASAKTDSRFFPLLISCFPDDHYLFPC